MPGAIADPVIEGPVVFVNMNVNDTATRGDYLGWSGQRVIAFRTGDAGFPYSGIGIALANNPTWVGPDQSGSAVRMPIGTHRGGTYRVTARPTDSGAYSAGQYVYPELIGSGIVGQTGATGRASLWNTAAGVSTLASATTARVFSASGNATNVVTGTAVSERYTINPNSAVGQIVRVHANASGASAQLEIILLDPRAVNTPLVNA